MDDGAGPGPARAGLLACLYILIGFPAQAQAVGDATAAAARSAPPTTTPPYRRRQPPFAATARPPLLRAASAAPAHHDIVADEFEAELNTVHDQLGQSQEFLREAARPSIEPASRRRCFWLSLWSSPP